MRVSNSSHQVACIEFWVQQKQAKF